MPQDSPGRAGPASPARVPLAPPPDYAPPSSSRAAVSAVHTLAPMKLGFKTAPQRVDWATLDAIWGLTGTLHVFDSAWDFAY